MASWQSLGRWFDSGSKEVVFTRKHFRRRQRLSLWCGILQSRPPLEGKSSFPDRESNQGRGGESADS